MVDPDADATTSTVFYNTREDDSPTEAYYDGIRDAYDNCSKEHQKAEREWKMDDFPS